jgi:hypothetical protein
MKVSLATETVNFIFVIPPINNQSLELQFFLISFITYGNNYKHGDTARR